MVTQLRAALVNDAAWWSLIDDRVEPLRLLLDWAEACEAGEPDTSLRFERRSDIERCHKVLDLFVAPWWGVVVYSCFDSLIGTRAAATGFSEPIPVVMADEAIDQIVLPPSSVQHHRMQATLTGAKKSLLSACEKADELEAVLTAAHRSFDDRFDELMRVKVSWWGRTSCFDALGRAGVLGAGGRPTDPARFTWPDRPAQRRNSEALRFGVPVTKTNADACEAILQRWTDRWSAVLKRVGAGWTGRPTTALHSRTRCASSRSRRTRGCPTPEPSAQRSVCGATSARIQVLTCQQVAASWPSRHSAARRAAPRRARRAVTSERADLLQLMR